MCKLVLDRGSIAEFTSVSNIFMDEYMPRANGEFIKIYLKPIYTFVAPC